MLQNCSFLAQNGSFLVIFGSKCSQKTQKHPHTTQNYPILFISTKITQNAPNLDILTQNHSNQLIFGSKCSKMLQISSFSYQNDRKTLKNTPRMSKTHPIFPISRHTRIRLHRPRCHCHRRHCRIQPRSVRFIGGNGGFWDEFRPISGDFEGFYR
jgi:hypothetical protein